MNYKHGCDTILDYIVLPVEPTKAPVNMKIVSVTKRETILSWEPIPCSDQNGKILYYVIRYYHQEVPETVLEHESQTDGNQLGITLRHLRPNTDYNATIAGANGAGIGVFSSPIVVITHGGKLAQYSYMDLHVTCLQGMTACVLFNLSSISSSGSCNAQII